jgi:effector-binding domain-containing protein
MDHEVTMADVPARRTAVIAATTTWLEFPTLWRELSGEVWGCLRANGIERGCRNVILYRNYAPTVEVGVLLDQPCSLTGRVIASTLPSGTTATTVHRGSFADLGAAHDAVVAWCAHHGHQPTGTRWEVYGPHDDDPSQQWTEISWLIVPATRWFTQGS